MLGDAHEGVLEEVAEQHAAEAAACWVLRDAAATSPAYDLADLQSADDRLERHLEGLRLAGPMGWELCAAALDDGEFGEAFAAAVTSLHQRDWPAFGQVLDAAGEDPKGARTIASALGWLDFDHVEVVLRSLLSAGAPPPLLYLGIAGHAVHRRDPGGALEQAATSPDARLRARALRAAGELGRADLGHAVVGGLAHDDEACRFWAAWSCVLLREPRGEPVLADLAAKGGPFAMRAAEMAVRCLDLRAARALVESLAGRGGAATRAALAGAGALGDPALVPLLLAHLRDDGTARLAAWSISLITNAGAAGPLRGRRPPGFQNGPTGDPADADVAIDPDDDLPWADPDGLERWWRDHEKVFAAATRHLLGRPMHADWLAHVLRAGNQAARAAAAIELCLLERGRPLFEVRAPGYLQHRFLAGGDG